MEEVPFVSGRGRAVFATVGVLSAAATNALLAAAALIGHYLVPNWEIDDSTPSVVFALFFGAAGFGATAAHLLAALAVCLWIHRTARNLDPLDRMTSGVSPAAAVGFWFVPFANLFKPYRIVKSIYGISAPEDGPLARDYLARYPGLLPAWWGAWIGYSALGNASFRLSLRDDGGDAPLWLDVWSIPFGLFAGGALVAIIWSIEVRHRHLHRLASAAEAPDDLTAGFRPPAPVTAAATDKA